MNRVRIAITCGAFALGCGAGPGGRTQSASAPVTRADRVITQADCTQATLGRYKDGPVDAASSYQCVDK